MVKSFSEGTWEWKHNRTPFINSLVIQGIYDVANEGKIRMDFENTRGILQITSVERNLIGYVIIGSTEGSYYEKK